VSLTKQVWKALLKVVDGLIMLLLAAMTAVIGIGVFYRYVLNNAIAWAEEFSRYCMIWFAMLGAGLALMRDEHVGVSAFINLLPEKLQRWIRQLGRSVVIVFLGITFIYSVKHLFSLQGQLSSALEMPMYVPYLSISAGMFLMLLVALRQLFGIKEDKYDDGLPLGGPHENEKID
jgi:TRAP-type C4-dicarboxylate transport system permease small subunit